MFRRWQLAQSGRPRSHLTLRERHVRQPVNVRDLGLAVLELTHAMARTAIMIDR